mmetsp:Transcript_15756/g.32280  ORF Transcript_15756/g.32280 Transcript_15756/m.32280 type:complete len:132 (-) Transcript_15756:32-427(-)
MRWTYLVHFIHKQKNIIFLSLLISIWISLPLGAAIAIPLFIFPIEWEGVLSIVHRTLSWILPPSARTGALPLSREATLPPSHDKNPSGKFQEGDTERESVENLISPLCVTNHPKATPKEGGGGKKKKKRRN